MRVLLLLLAVLLGLAQAQQAKACSCIRQTPEEGFATADAVFSGTIAEVKPNPDSERGGFLVTIEVLEAWKGVTEPIVKVSTAANSAICGYAFQVGRSYLVYASRDGSRPLRVSLCSRTQLLDAAGEDLKSLGKPSVRISSADEKAKKSAADSGACAVAWSGREGTGLGAAMAGLLLLALLWRGAGARTRAGGRDAGPLRSACGCRGALSGKSRATARPKNRERRRLTASTEA